MTITNELLSKNIYLRINSNKRVVIYKLLTNNCTKQLYFTKYNNSELLQNIQITIINELLLYLLSLCINMDKLVGIYNKTDNNCNKQLISANAIIPDVGIIVNNIKLQ